MLYFFSMLSSSVMKVESWIFFMSTVAMRLKRWPLHLVFGGKDIRRAPLGGQELLDEFLKMKSKSINKAFSVKSSQSSSPSSRDWTWMDFLSRYNSSNLLVKNVRPCMIKKLYVANSNTINNQKILVGEKKIESILTFMLIKLIRKILPAYTKSLLKSILPTVVGLGKSNFECYLTN